MRSGDEPGHARSPLEFRLGLAAFGLAMALVSAVVVRPVAPTAVVVLFLLIALVAAVDLVAVRRQMKRGAHFQPGPEVPPYRPVEAAPPVRPQRAPATERTRMRRYLALMATCLTLIILAWFWVRFYSTTIAVAMSMVAAVLPSIAVIVANFGVRLPDEPPAPPVPPVPPVPPERPVPPVPPAPRPGRPSDTDHPDPPGHAGS
jgi:hypothetical protein